MREIFRKYIEWEKLGAHDRDDYDIEVEDAVINSSNGVLTLRVVSNFVVPYGDEQKIKGIIKAGVEGINDVKMEYTYRDMILTPEEELRAVMPAAAAGLSRENPVLLRLVMPEKARLEGRVLTVPVMGNVACEQLNGGPASLLGREISGRLGRNFEVRFINDEEHYDTRRESLEKAQEKELAAATEKVRLAAEAAERRTGTDQRTGRDGRQGETAAGGRPPRGPRRRGDGREAPASGNILMGRRHLTGDITALAELDPASPEVTVEGIVFDKEARTIKSGSRLISILITDKVTSTCLKSFVSEKKWDEIDPLIRSGDTIRAHGSVEWDRYENAITVMIDGIEKTDAVRIRPESFDGKKRVELHCHTKMSAMDGLSEVDRIVRTAACWGQPAVAITDHGVVQSFPDAAKAAQELASDGEDPKKIKIIYGCEAYVLDDEGLKDSEGHIDYRGRDTHHIILLAATQTGLRNLYKLVSLSHIKYFYKKPRIPWSVLNTYREGIIVGSACEAGEVYRAVAARADDAALDRIAGRYDYLEIQPLINNHFMIENGEVSGSDELKDFNRRIVECADRLGKPVVATTDAHYEEPEDAIYRNILMAGMGFRDAERGQGLYLRTTAEMLEEFSYLGAGDAYRVVVENTNRIADMVSSDILPVPKGKYPPRIEGAGETLRASCMKRAHELYGDPLPEVIGERLEKELNSIIGNGYAVMYVSAQMLVRKSMEDGYLVGSRGSVGSSFAATMAGITEVNPLDPHYICPDCRHLEWGDKNLYDCGIDMPPKKCPLCGTEMRRDGFTIPFATFLGFNGDKEPDIDLNFASEEQPVAHRYVGAIFGEQNVFKAGTVSTVAEKTAEMYVRHYAEQTGRPINRYDIKRLALGCQGVKKTTGQHPGGIVIVPDDHEIYEFCPVQRPANDAASDIVTTHFDYHKIDQNLLKLDILGHNIPSMIRQLQDMTGVDPLSIDLSDRKVLSIFTGVEALDIRDKEYRFVHGSYGIPEFGTAFVRQMLDDTRPQRFADLVRISGFSHGTDVWLNNAQEFIRSGEASMREVISTRDDIMNYLILKGLDNKAAFDIMEHVRKKDKVVLPEEEELMRRRGVPEWYIESCKRIKYMFPRGHAVAYTMMSFRMAWYKVYYPEAFYATHFTSEIAGFHADVILEGAEACLAEIDRINSLGDAASDKEKDRLLVYEVAYEMYARGYGFGPPRLGASRALQFWVEDGCIIIPFAALEGVGESAARSLVQAYGEKPFDTVEEAINRAKLNRTAVETLRRFGVFAGLPETDQLSFFGVI